MMTQVALVTLSPATLAQLEAYFRDPAELADLLGARLPEGWPIDPTAFLHVANALHLAPDAASHLMYWAFDPGSGALIGDGGWREKGDGVIEVAWEIAEEHRGRGLALGLVQALRDRAFDDPAVTRIDAHIRCEDSASSRTLARAGFQKVEDEMAMQNYWRRRGRCDAWTLER
jgi:ribosomal-protein-alanine N-acetyltransferase